MSSAKSTFDIKNFHLSPEQATALAVLQSGENVFLTGGAGSGKSHLIRAFMSQQNSQQMPILASTGAAAVLVGGRTFHSFFGLGIMEGGPEATLKKALNDRRLIKRVSQVEGFILDEVSMIPSQALEVAEQIARSARSSTLPWGGLRVILVGDFAQLPPVTRSGPRHWAFRSQVWRDSGLQVCALTHNHRIEDRDYLDILADIRCGRWSSHISDFLQSHQREPNASDKATRLFALRDQVEQFNQQELAQLSSPEVRIDSIYLGDAQHVQSLQRQSPVPTTLVLKKGCRVLFLQNDPQRRWVNGTQGTVTHIDPEQITVEKNNGREVTVEKASFSWQDAEGNVKASVINFPLLLAYATTIHRSQGATLDSLWVDLSRLWEPGHAYVALSRLRSPAGLSILRWNRNSFVVDPLVNQFYENLQSIELQL